MDFISLFSGGGGADIGAMQVGFTPVAANEYDADIAAVYRENIGNHIRVGDILEQAPKDYPSCYLLHLSPPCPNFSVAKAGRKETQHDIALAEKSAEFIRVLSPQAVTVENVGLYRKSESFRIIMQAIEDGGYMYDVAMLNAADYGVPQTRRRLFVRAKRGLLKPMPEPVRWVGWYEAIEDLIPMLPDSHFAPWQLKRLPEFVKNSFVFEPTEMRDNGHQVGCDKPCYTINVSRHLSGRAFIVDDQRGSSFETKNDRGLSVRNDDEPTFTQSIGSGGHPIRAWLSCGRVVAMTPRCLARFQSFPDWYELPEKKSLACKIIGNAVPPLMYEAVAKTLL